MCSRLDVQGTKLAIVLSKEVEDLTHEIHASLSALHRAAATGRLAKKDAKGNAGLAAWQAANPPPDPESVERAVMAASEALTKLVARSRLEILADDHDRG